MNKHTIDQLAVILANSYALYLKSQNYHWHVKGLAFKTMHDLFEEHYSELADAVDDIAERIIILGGQAPATFGALNQLKTSKDGDANLSVNDMLSDLKNDHQAIINDLQQAIASAADNNDEGTVALLGERIANHEKMAWMLATSLG